MPGEAAIFICVWYPPPFGDGQGKVLPETMPSQMAESSGQCHARPASFTPAQQT
jgi:hypothetical protein